MVLALPMADETETIQGIVVFRLLQPASKAVSLEQITRDSGSQFSFTQMFKIESCVSVVIDRTNSNVPFNMFAMWYLTKDFAFKAQQAPTHALPMIISIMMWQNSLFFINRDMNTLYVAKL